MTLPIGVLVPERMENDYWLPMTRWLECYVGALYVDWDANKLRDEDGYRYEFARQRDAEAFCYLFLRDHKIFRYEFWEEFWMNDLGRGRMNALWNEKGWRPETVLVQTPLTGKSKRVLSGAHALFKPNWGWFFEKERDALMFLFEG